MQNGWEAGSRLVIDVLTSISALTQGPRRSTVKVWDGVLHCLDANLIGYPRRKISINIYCFGSIVGNFCHVLAYKTNTFCLILASCMTMSVPFAFSRIKSRTMDNVAAVGREARLFLSSLSEGSLPG